MSDKHDVRDLDHDGGDDALLHRLFDLACGKRCDRGELERVDSQVYARLIETYDAAWPARLPGRSRRAPADGAGTAVRATG